MELLLNLLSPIVNVVLGVDKQHGDRTLSRAVDIGRFLDVLEAHTSHLGLHPCGDSSFCLGEAVLVWEAQLLNDASSFEVAQADLRARGASIDKVETSEDNILCFSAHLPTYNVRGRVVPTRGWAFLVAAPDAQEADRLTDILDDHLRMELGRGGPTEQGRKGQE
jgi:hypothetical protein